MKSLNKIIINKWTTKMKIMFATDEKELGSNIAKRFGHAAYYIIYDSEKKLADARINNGHDDNHSSLVDLMNEGITHFVIGNIGPQAFNVLKKGDSHIYLARKMTAQVALDKMMNNSLEELDEPTLKRSIEDHEHSDGHEHKHQSEQDRHSHNGRHNHH